MRVLVIEDDDSVARMLSVLLRMQSLEVEIAPNGAAGLASFQRLPPDLVVLDLRLPGMNGLEVCRRLRFMTPEMGIICLSGGGCEARSEALSAGADVFLRKPFDVDEFQEAVWALLSGCWLRAA